MDHVTWITTMTLALVLSFVFCSPVAAEEDVVTTTPEVIPPVEEIIPPVETPTSTPDSQNQTPTTTEDSTTTTTDNFTTTTPPITNDLITSAVNKILNYLKTQQSEDGKIIDGTITDWAIMSFGANGEYAENIKQTSGASLLDYEKKYNLDDPSDMNACATYPRHILALLAGGVEPTDSAILGLKDKINTICYQNNLYGLNGINDDIFALLALSALNTNQSEPIMLDIVSTTLSWQMENGAFSWPDWFNPSAKVAGDDITGAAIDALKYAQTKGASVDENIFDKAKTYLKSSQQTDGGWGYGSSDVMTTSWVLMGINALHNTQNDWFVTSTGKNPWHPLVNNLKAEGFYESAWAPGTVDWFAMKHAVPALAGKFWPIVLTPIVKNFSEGATFTYGGNCCSSYTPPPVIEVPTTTTTTTVFIVTPTSTPTTTVQIPNPDNQTSTSTLITTPTTTPTYSTFDILYSSTSTPTTTIQDTDSMTQETTTTTIVTTTQNTNNKTQKQIPDNKYQITDKAGSQSSVLNPQSPVISPATSSTAPISPAKIAFATSVTAAGGLGLYLTWRLLQTLI